MAQTNNKTASLGTFSGVFTPSILTILGIILFLRLGFVVGNAGLKNALLIMCIANLISILTSFSLAAIATNMKVKGGGDYYLISRTLGVEFGGAIGIVLFLAQSVSIAFYCIGFGEAVSAIFASGKTNFSPQIIALSALLFLFVLAWIGADLATKFQYIVMVFLVLALASFYSGGIQKWETGLLFANWTRDDAGMGFWILFAIFFPAVTGFTQGVSMSGDLKDSGKSLPKGTFSAVFVSILVYFSIAVIFAASTPLDMLATDYGAMKKTAFYGVFIDAGVIAATLSSAMASFLGAPRILQSLATDKIFPFLNGFAKGDGKANNPRRGVLLSFFIAIIVIAIGQLDLIAKIVSMFFLISYGLLNYATYFEAATLSPSFRPRFKWYHRRISLTGFLACVGVMLAIDIKTGISASAILFAIYQYLKRTQGPARWADSQRSYHLQRVRANLLAAQEDLAHPREWRPYILALSNHSDTLMELLCFSELIEGGSGMTTAVRLIRGSGYRMTRLKEKYLNELKKEISTGKHHAFPLVVSCIDSENGISTLLQSYGIGSIQANTVLFNHCELQGDENTTTDFLNNRNHMRLSLQFGCNIVLVNAGCQALTTCDSIENDKKKCIHVWWNNDDSSRLMLLLAYLITRNRTWESADIFLLAVNYDRDNKDNMNALSTLLEDIRIQATPAIILGLDADTLIEKSKAADLVFLPMDLHGNDVTILSKFDTGSILPELNSVAMVKAANRIDLDTEPEEGKIQELAQIYDELKHAQKRAALAEKSATLAAETAREKMVSIQDKNQIPDTDLKEKIQQLLSARKDADAARQKAKEEKAKLLATTRKAEEQGIEINGQKKDKDHGNSHTDGPK